MRLLPAITVRTYRTREYLTQKEVERLMKAASRK